MRILTLLIAAFLFLLAGCATDDQAVIPSEIEHRLQLVQGRIFRGQTPRITEDFLLAGLTLDPQFERRFTNYSGDQIGRYLSAVTHIEAADNPIDIHKLVEQIAANQKADGRFGADSLVFDAALMEGPHMALLWGNGRLLTGLMDYYQRYPDRPIALESAKKLGGFLIGVTDACTRPAIIERFKTMGAMGFICFTQITEGMVKLYEATGDEVYVKTAERIYPLLPEFGNQHSHGFLNTLRGVVMLYEATKEPRHLAYVEQVFEQIIASGNYMITGGVPEFFGFHASAEGIRDEGCSEADFFMLCLQLWRATGKMSYLDHAEYLFMNHMLYNQFATGDFGHHVIDTEYNLGFRVAAIQGRSWWCCNYHGLQALVEAQKAISSAKDGVTRIHLYYPRKIADAHFIFTVEKIRSAAPQYAVKVENIFDRNAQLALRNPSWSVNTKVLLNGKNLSLREENGYLHIDRNLQRNDVVQITFQPKLRLVDRVRREMPLNQLTDKPITGALLYGPWLLAVDDIFDPLFTAEPSVGNVIFLTTDGTIKKTSLDKLPQNAFHPEAYLSFDYRHEGMYEIGRVTLRPLSESSFLPPANVRFWFNFAAKPEWEFK